MDTWRVWISGGFNFESMCTLMKTIIKRFGGRMRDFFEIAQSSERKTSLLYYIATSQLSEESDIGLYSEAVLL